MELSVRRILNDAVKTLVDNGVPNARRNAEWMLGHVLDCRNAELYVASERVLATESAERFAGMIERRAQREPLQYILESTEFMGLPFMTTPGVFIPRPDTERLIEWCEVNVDLDKGPDVLDLCCGSGVIPVSLLGRWRALRATAVDVSEEAVKLTARNALNNGVLDRLTIIMDDAVEFVARHAQAFDLITCNPPYIASGDMLVLPPEVKNHEPALSLDGGADGLDFFRRVAPPLSRALRTDGAVVFEIGAGQAQSVGELLGVCGFGAIEVEKDYAGLDRFVAARR